MRVSPWLVSAAENIERRPYCYAYNPLYCIFLYRIFKPKLESTDWKANHSLANTPSALIDRFINSTFLNLFRRRLFSCLYCFFFRIMLFFKLDSKPIDSSKTYRQLLFEIKRSGRWESPVIIEGLLKSGRSA